MALPVPIMAPLSKDDKTALLRKALQALRESEAIDERESELDPDSLRQWYDDTIPLVIDIRQLVGAMEIELSRRRGELIAREGEQRGGQHGNQFTGAKLSQRDSLPNAAMLQRSRDRAIAAEPDAVTAYVQEEVAAQRVPSKRGAVRAARKARAAKPKVTKAKAKAKVKAGVPVSFAPRVEAPQLASARAQEETLRLFALVRDEPLTLLEIAARCGVKTEEPRHQQERARVIRDRLASAKGIGMTQVGESNSRSYDCEARYTFTVLPEAAAWEAKLAAVEAKYEQFLADLHEEIKKRRAEARDGYNAWKPENINTRQQSKLLDRVEDALKLRAIPALHTPLAPAMSQEKAH